ncbi:MAG: hypothetical protein KGI54_14470 [Pseudomonadota bacterium]|nr:hypothetical protein [Pseudomonadota bacterium]
MKHELSTLTGVDNWHAACEHKIDKRKNAIISHRLSLDEYYAWKERVGYVTPFPLVLLHSAAFNSPSGNLIYAPLTKSHWDYPQRYIIERIKPIEEKAKAIKDRLWQRRVQYISALGYTFPLTPVVHFRDWVKWINNRLKTSSTGYTSTKEILPNEN